jgi:hypothetical protein
MTLGGLSEKLTEEDYEQIIRVTGKTKEEIDKFLESS